MDAHSLSWSLLAAAFGVGVVHTLLGPEHYLPFIMLARARGWSRLRTVAVTVACGVGHILSSVALGGLGIVFGLAIGRMENLESGRGPIAAWALVAFGVAYALWGLRHALRKRKGIEAHVHGDEVHIHSHALSPHGHAVLTAIVFGIATLASMVGATLAGYEGLRWVNFGRLERWSHVVAGTVIAAAGLSVIYLGL